MGGGSVDEIIKAYRASGAAEPGQPHFFLFAGFKADGCAGGDVEAHSEGFFAREVEFAVDLVKMKMRADLYWPVALIDDGNRFGAAAGADRATTTRLIAIAHLAAGSRRSRPESLGPEPLRKANIARELSLDPTVPAA